MIDNYRALPIGTMISDYQIQGVLGQGAFGITYLANDIATNLKVAIKEYYPREFAVRDSTLTVKASGSKEDRDNFKWGLERFEDEARVIALFQHPNIVTVERFFRENGTAYLVMEYCDGIPLDEQLKEVSFLSQQDLIKLIVPILNALELIHNSKYLHRDIKPGNIYIRSNGTPILLDFGAARQDLVSHSRSITSLATPGYAPYEQYSTHAEQGPSSDIYGFAATLYKVVTGKRPLDAPSRVLDDTQLKAKNIASGQYDENILNAIDAGLAVKPSDRPSSIAAWRKIFGPLVVSNSDEVKNTTDFGEYIRFDSPTVDLDPIDNSPRIGFMDGKTTHAKIYTVVGLGVLLLLICLGYLNFVDGNIPHINPKPVPIPLAKTNDPSINNQPASPSLSPSQGPIANPSNLPACPSSVPSSSWTNCYGTFTFSSTGPNKGDKYTGTFKDGEFDGQGVYLFGDGKRYVGSIKRGKRDGYGTLFASTGAISYRGIWSNDLPINEVIITKDSPRSEDLTLEQCNQIAGFTRKDLPKVVDNITKWTHTTCVVGPVRPAIVYWYEVDTADIYHQSLINYLREDTKKSVCTKEMRKLLSGLDVKYTYTYSSKKNYDTIGSLYYSLADCRK